MLTSQKGFIHLIPVLLLLVGIGLGTYLVHQRTNLFPKASFETKRINLNDLSEDTTSVGLMGVSLDGNSKSAAVLIKEQGLFRKLSTTPKPNIIIIITDDQIFKQLSLAGNGSIKTANIDSLANPGAYFKNAYVPEGICSPSRASIWTSKLPHIHGVDAADMILPADQITLPEILKANGYNTGFIGKCHLGDQKAPEEWTRGFDFRLINKLSAGMVLDWNNYQVTRNGTLENHTEYVTDFLTIEAVNYISSKSQEYKTAQKPFFLWLAQPAPHVPTIPPKGSSVYSANQFSLPQSSSDDLTTKPPLQALTKYHSSYLNLGETSMITKIKESAEVVANLDSNIGKINQALINQGIKDDTVVVFLSDNGIFLGEHQIYQKGPYFYDEQVKSPLIFSYPKLISQSKTIESLTSTMDIMPTLLELLSIPNPSNIQGISFLDVLKGTKTENRRSVYLEYPNQRGCMTYPLRGVVMDGFKWVHTLPGKYDPVNCAKGNNSQGVSFDGQDQELYDLKNDPLEINNLMKRLGPSDSPLERLLVDQIYGKIVQKLRKERAVWATDTKDPNRFTLTDGSVISPNSTTLTVYWKNGSGSPTSEVEYQEKNCSTCPVLEHNDFRHISNVHTVTLSNLKPNTTYKIRAFSIGKNGVGGYLDLEGTTQSSSGGPTALPTPTSQGCTSNDQCSFGKTCQTACTLTYPPTCKGVCTTTQTPANDQPSTLTPGTIEGMGL